jgi:hypothetical protein
LKKFPRYNESYTASTRLGTALKLIPCATIDLQCDWRGPRSTSRTEGRMTTKLEQLDATHKLRSLMLSNRAPPSS